MLDFSNHFAHLNSTPFLQSAQNSDLPPFNQQLMDRTKSTPYFLFYDHNMQ